VSLVDVGGFFGRGLLVFLLVGCCVMWGCCCVVLFLCWYLVVW